MRNYWEPERLKYVKYIKRKTHSQNPISQEMILLTWKNKHFNTDDDKEQH
jgi:hypothetical protein